MRPGARAQPKAQDTASADHVDRGYLSPTAYTNAFFGFKVPIPLGIDFQLFMPKGGLFADAPVLFGLQSAQGGVTIFTIMSQPSGGARAVSAEQAVHWNKGKTEKKMIGGKEFWESSGAEPSKGGKMNKANYATEWNGQVLSFLVMSFDGRIYAKFREAIESVQFFDPAKAKELAGPGSFAYPVKTAWADGPTIGIKTLDGGNIKGDMYNNPQLGLAFRIPSGWNHPDAETQKAVIETGHRAAFGSDPSEDAEHEQSVRCTKNLIWLTKDPMGTTSGTFNPLVSLSAADERCDEGIRFPTSIDDREGIERFASQMRLGLVGTPLPESNDVTRAFPVDGHLVLEVAGHRSISVPGEAHAKDVYLAIRMMELKGFVLSWMYEAGSAEELKEISRFAVKFDFVKH